MDILFTNNSAYVQIAHTGEPVRTENGVLIRFDDEQPYYRARILNIGKPGLIDGLTLGELAEIKIAKILFERPEAIKECRKVIYGQTGIHSYEVQLLFELMRAM